MNESEAKTIDDCINELRKHRNVYLKRSTPWRVVNRALHLIEQYRAIGTVEEFKDLKEKNGWHDMEMYGLGYNQGTIDRADELQKCREQGYNKAIDEFAERIKQGDVIEYMGSYVSYEAIANFIDKIAEQMKGEQL